MTDEQFDSKPAYLVDSGTVYVFVHKGKNERISEAASTFYKTSKRELCTMCTKMIKYYWLISHI